VYDLFLKLKTRASQCNSYADKKLDCYGYVDDKNTDLIEKNQRMLSPDGLNCVYGDNGRVYFMKGGVITIVSVP